MAAFIREFYLESENIFMNIYQNIEGDVSCVMWDAALVLSAYLDHKNKEIKKKLKGKSVIELGSGVGCVGLTAACLGANVIATDLPDVIPHLKINIEANQESVNCNGGSIQAQELDWTNVGSSLSSPDLLLLADCVYYEKALEPLVDVITSISGTDTEVWITQEMRDSVRQQGLWKEFQEKLSDNFIIKCIPQELQHPIYSSTDILLLQLKKKST